MQSHLFFGRKRREKTNGRKPPERSHKHETRRGGWKIGATGGGEVARKGGDGDAFKGSGRQSKERKGGGENAEQ